MKWGTKYGPEYVNRLYNMAARNITPPFQLICFTDDSSGLNPAIRALPLPDLGCEPPLPVSGQWQKLALWSADLFGLQGTALFIDLDSIIVGSLDAYFSHRPDKDVILQRDWARPLLRLGQTSVFRFQIGSHQEILEQFRRDPQGIADRFRWEQDVVTHGLRNQLTFWPRGWTRHFRLDCLGPDPLRFLRPARLPAGSRIITFPGGAPNPPEARLGKWRPESPDYAGRRAHLKQQLRHLRWKKFREFLMPVSWIDKHWQ
jgi:hypothetical protein